jgi:hypothetical protein
MALNTSIRVSKSYRQSAVQTLLGSKYITQSIQGILDAQNKQFNDQMFYNFPLNRLASSMPSAKVPTLASIA